MFSSEEERGIRQGAICSVVLLWAVSHLVLDSNHASENVTGTTVGRLLESQFLSFRHLLTKVI